MLHFIRNIILPKFLTIYSFYFKILKNYYSTAFLSLIHKYQCERETLIGCFPLCDWGSNTQPGVVPCRELSPPPFGAQDNAPTN